MSQGREFIIESEPEVSKVSVKTFKNISIEDQKINLIQDIFEELRDRVSEIMVKEDSWNEELSSEETGYNMGLEVVLDLLDDTEDEFMGEFTDFPTE